MRIEMNSADYIAYLIDVKELLEGQKDYITKLDATTGDGDHWVNLYQGYEKIVAQANDLSSLDLSSMLKQVGMIMFSSIGGSSGALYGSGYIAASKAVEDIAYLDINSLYNMLDAMLRAIMKRGKTEPGQKTMVDSLSRALIDYKRELEANSEEKKVIEMFVEGAKEGASQTKEMEAVKGRASYRTDKGVGHLDPGAVTMALQLECLGSYLLNKGEN